MLQVQCKIFSTTFNPEGVRLGNKILRERLRGPALAAYYPRKVATIKDLRKAYPELETWNEKEEDRLETVAITKARGKGAPKKKRTAAGKSIQRKRMLSGELGNANISIYRVQEAQGQEEGCRRRRLRWDIACILVYDGIIGVWKPGIYQIHKLFLCKSNTFMIKQQFDQKTLLRPFHGPCESSVTVLLEINFWGQPRKRRLSVHVLPFVKSLQSLICMIYAPIVCIVSCLILFLLLHKWFRRERRVLWPWLQVDWRRGKSLKNSTLQTRGLYSRREMKFE